MGERTWYAAVVSRASIRHATAPLLMSVHSQGLAIAQLA